MLGEVLEGSYGIPWGVSGGSWDPQGGPWVSCGVLGGSTRGLSQVPVVPGGSLAVPWGSLGFTGPKVPYRLDQPDGPQGRGLQ